VRCLFIAILSGTDPIAVAGLLKTAGSPDRLNMHIAGESLLNDGSVVVLFNVFSRMYYHEHEFPEESGSNIYTYGSGFAYFFKVTLGGCAIGFAFGLGTVLMLKALCRRLSERENVFQVVLLVSSAYLGYFTAEVLAGCSGIMATITLGLTVKVLGETFINDHALTHHFWHVTAELLNQLLFVLGGCVWGDIVRPGGSFIHSVSNWVREHPCFLVYTSIIANQFTLSFSRRSTRLIITGLYGTSLLTFDCYPICSGIWAVPNYISDWNRHECERDCFHELWWVSGDSWYRISVVPQFHW
jgi:hypothetical protein